jgi:hypothetical protein
MPAIVVPDTSSHDETSDVEYTSPPSSPDHPDVVPDAATDGIQPTAPPPQTPEDKAGYIRRVSEGLGALIRRFSRDNSHTQQTVEQCKAITAQGLDILNSNLRLHTSDISRDVLRRVDLLESRYVEQELENVKVMQALSGNVGILADAMLKAKDLMAKVDGKIPDERVVPRCRAIKRKSEEDRVFDYSAPSYIATPITDGTWESDITKQTGLVQRHADSDDETAPKTKLVCDQEKLPVCDYPYDGPITLPRQVTLHTMIEVAHTMAKRENLQEKKPAVDGSFQLDGTKLFKNQLIEFKVNGEKLTRLMHLAQLAVEHRRNFRMFEEDRNKLLYIRQIHFFNCPEIKDWCNDLASRSYNQKTDETHLSIDQLDSHTPYYTCTWFRRLREYTALYDAYLRAHEECMREIREIVTSQDW